jgi:myosin heavy subunit
MGIINNVISLVPKTSKEIAQIEDVEISIGDIDINELPSIINGQIGKYKELEKSIDVSLKKAKEAEERAESAQGQSAGFWNRRNAIEAGQEATVGNAEAIMALANSQKISLEFQTKLAEISKFLLMLGLNNIALNRTTIRQLELKLEGASKEELSELVKSEIKNVIQELKARQDLIEKHNRLDEKTKELHKKQETYTVKVEEHEDKIESNIKKLRENAKKLKNNSEMIQSLVEELGKHESSINTIKRSIAKKEKNNSEMIQSLVEELKKHENTIKRTNKKVDDIKNLKEYIIEKYPKIKLYFFLLCGIIGSIFILSIISLIFALIK